MRFRIFPAALLALLSLLVTPTTLFAQERTAPPADSARPVRGKVGTLPTRTSTSPSLKRLTDRAVTRAKDDDDDSPQRSRAKKAGVLDTSGGKKLGFDPKKLGKKTTEELAQEKLNTDNQDIIEWKSNFEKGMPCQKIPLDAKINLDFHEMALGELTKYISCATERNFILTGGANKNATVSILSPTPVTIYEAYKAYLSALEANGLTVIKNGQFYEIVASGEARQAGTKIFRRGQSAKAEDIMVTRLIQLEHIEAQEILPVLDKFKTKAADVTIYAPTNTLIFTDTGTNIKRVQKLIKELDVPVGKEKIWIRPVQYADSKDVLSLLQTLFGTKGSAKKGSKQTKKPITSSRSSKGSKRTTTSVSTVIGDDDVTSVQVSTMLSDDRTNSLILVANRTSYLRLDRLIRKIDVPIPGEGQIHIHALENAEAEEIAQTLTSLASGSKKKSGKSSSRKSKKSKSSSGAVGQLLEGEVKVTAYKPTNSLVIEASLKDYMSLQRVIRQLDVRRKQVYVEAIIMEISQNKQRDVGLSGSGGATIDVEGETLPLLFGVGGLGLDVQSALQTLGDGGGAIGLQGPMLDVSGGAADGAASGGSFSIPAFGFLLKALQTTANVNVLSTPHILTVENEEAEIQVGKRQPYRNNSLGGGLGGLSSLAGLGGASSALGGLGGLGSLGSLGGLGSSVQYVDVDLTLKIKPQVNASDYIRLEIDQSIDDIDGFFAEAPITSKRKIQNVVVVRDGQPVVIGGLMRDQETKSTEKVPILGDIPLIGLAFRRTSTSVEKRNLLLVIIPHVIKDPSDLKRIHDRRRDEYREFAKTMAQRKKEYAGEMDFRKKTGLLQEMHTVLSRAQRERELREATDFENRDRDLVGPAESHDIEYMPPIPQSDVLELDKPSAEEE